jgi:hypothetical protein
MSLPQLVVGSLTSNFLKICTCVGVLVVAWNSGPQSALIDLETLIVRSPEHHGADPPVPNRQRLRPFLRRLVVFEAKIRLGYCRSQCKAVPVTGINITSAPNRICFLRTSAIWAIRSLSLSRDT